MPSAACCGKEQLFFAEELDPAAYHDALSETDKKVEAAYLENAVTCVSSALEACKRCPLLQLCRAETAELVANNAAPCGIVRAGIYWGYDGRPYPTLNGCLTKESADKIRANVNGKLRDATFTNEYGDEFPRTVQVTFKKRYSATEDGIINADFSPWDYTWIPALHTPLNEIAIDAALSQDIYRPVVTERWLALNAGRINKNLLKAEVLSDADVCEFIRRAAARGLATRRVATILRMKWDHVQQLRYDLGVATPSTTALPEISHPEVEELDFEEQWTNSAPGEQLAFL